MSLEDEDVTEDEIKCPYCDATKEDSWEQNMCDGEEKIITCDACEKDFDCSCSIIILYTTSKIGYDEI